MLTHIAGSGSLAFMETVALPGLPVTANACLAHLSLRGANQFCAEISGLFPNVMARFQEDSDGDAWLELARVDCELCVRINAFVSDSMHKAVAVADLLNKGYFVSAIDYQSGW